MSRWLLLSLCLLNLPAGAVEPSDARDQSAEAIVLHRCPVEYSRTTLLASPLSSILADRLVEPGEEVKAGQVLGRLQGLDVRAELERQKAAAESDISVRVTEAKYARALGKLKASESLFKRKFMSPDEFELDRLDAAMAKVGIEEAKHQQRLAHLQVKQAEALVRIREFVSPHDGIVVEVLKNQGESAALNEPIFRIVETDRMRVAGQLDIVDAWRVQKSQRARVTLEIEGADLKVEREVFTGSVVFIDRRIAPATQTCKVIVEVPNRDHLLYSGLLAQIELLALRQDGPGSRPTGPKEVCPLLEEAETPHETKSHEGTKSVNDLNE